MVKIVLQIHQFIVSSGIYDMLIQRIFDLYFGRILSSEVHFDVLKIPGIPISDNRYSRYRGKGVLPFSQKYGLPLLQMNR